MIKIGMVGGTGYTGAELLRLLVQHPQVEITAITSRTAAGTPVAALFPHLRKHLDLNFSAPDATTLGVCDVVFFATPNGTAMEQAPALLDAGVRIIDLAADFRLRDPAQWRHWYGIEHACPERLATAVYGLPEWYRTQIRTARLVANPGCYPTAVLIGLLPLLEARIVDPNYLIADAKSGVSGAGRGTSVANLMAEMGESFKAYGLSGHRHLAEISQYLEQCAGQAVGITFAPHLLPMIRGIEATLYARLITPETDLQQLFERRYQNEPFVDVMPPGSYPETRSVRGANLCRLAVHRPQNGAMVVVSAVIDNLVKGAAGQAIQNMNLMLGFEETMGLTAVALQP